jgi:hypothetical protein
MASLLGEETSALLQPIAFLANYSLNLFIPGEDICFRDYAGRIHQVQSLEDFQNFLLKFHYPINKF